MRKLDFARRLMLQFRASVVTCDSGFPLHREPDHALGLHAMAGDLFADEGKKAINSTRLSCMTRAANVVRQELHALAYNLDGFLRTLATPEPVGDWCLASLKEKVITIGA